MGTQQNNTMAEFCNKMMKVIADAKQMPDADMEFLGAIEGDLLTYLKPPVPAAANGDPNAGAMNGAMAQVTGQPVASIGAGAPNADELRRTLAGPR